MLIPFVARESGFYLRIRGLRLIKGKKKKVAINHWRLRRTLTMGVSSTGRFSAKSKLPLRGCVARAGRVRGFG